MTMKLSALTAYILFLAGTAAAASEGPNRKDDAVKWTFQAGAVHQFKSSLDRQGRAASCTIHHTQAGSFSMMLRRPFITVCALWIFGLI